jgi:hypothetical protein
LLKVLWGAALLLLCVPIVGVQRDVWDGVIGAYGIERNDFSGIHAWLVPSNWDLVYLLLRGMQGLSGATSIPAWIWVKLLLLASLVGISNESRQLCRRVLGWSDVDSRLAGLLTLSFPCWYLLYGSTFIYLVFIWAVFAGHRLLHDGTNRASRLAGFVLIVMSFQVNSNLVMVFALEAVRWLYRAPGGRWNWSRSAAVAAAAVAVYIALRLVWTPHGPYAGYNSLAWPFSVAGARSWSRALLMALTWLPWLLAPAAVAWAVAGRQAPDGASGRPERREAAAMALLLAGALFAYMAVGKGAPLFVINLPLDWLATGRPLGKSAPGWFYTTADGWSMRNAFLLSVPAAIAATGLIRWTLRDRVAGGHAAGWYAALACALAINLFWLADGHAAKQLRMAQEESIIRALRGQPPPPSGTVDLEIAPRVGWTVWTYEANYWFWRAYGRTQWAAAAFTADPSERLRALEDRQQAIASPLPRSHFLMDEASLPGCHSSYEIELPSQLGPFSFAADLVGLRPIAAARISRKELRCPLR